MVKYILNNRERNNYDSLNKKINSNFKILEENIEELVIIKKEKELNQFLKNNLKHKNYHLNFQNNIFQKLDVKEILEITDILTDKKLNFNFLYIPKNKRIKDIKRLIKEYNALIANNEDKKFYLNIDLDIDKNKLMEIIEKLNVNIIDFNFSISKMAEENFFNIIPKIKNKKLGLRKLKITNFECGNLFKKLELKKYELEENDFSPYFFEKFGFKSFSRWVGGGYYPSNQNFKRLNKNKKIEIISETEIENNYNNIEENQKTKLTEKQIKNLNSSYYIYNLTDSILKNK